MALYSHYWQHIQIRLSTLKLVEIKSTGSAQKKNFWHAATTFTLWAYQTLNRKKKIYSAMSEVPSPAIFLTKNLCRWDASVDVWTSPGRFPSLSGPKKKYLQQESSLSYERLSTQVYGTLRTGGSQKTLYTQQSAVCRGESYLLCFALIKRRGIQESRKAYGKGEMFFVI